MTTIYLDTSVAITEAFLKSSYAEAFFKACTILQYTVVIPEIVIDELKGNFPQKLKEKSELLNKAKKELRRFIDIEIPNISLQESGELYENWLDELIDEHGIIIAPYPNVPTKELIKHSYEAKKPFKESG